MYDRSLTEPYRNGNGHQSQPVPVVPEDDEISLHEIFVILLKGKWIIFASFLLVFGAVAAYTFTREPEYEASSIIYVDTQQSTPQLGEMLGLEVGNRNINNEVEILKSRSSALRVAEKLMTSGQSYLVDTTLTVLRAKEDVVLTMNDVAARLRNQYVTVRPVGRDVDLIEITATSTVPAEARQIANLYAETYRDYNRTSSRSRMTASREFLDEVTTRFAEQLQATESELTSFLNQEKIVEPDEQARQLLEQVSQLQTLQYQAQLELGMTQAELSGLEAEVDQITPGLAAQISSSDDVMVERLKEQIAALQIEEQQIFARNPDLRGRTPTGRLAEIEREVTELTRQLDERVERLVSSALQSGSVAAAAGTGEPGVASSQLQAVQQLRRVIMEKNIELSGHRARLDIINSELDKYKAQLAEIPNKALVLERLQRSRQSQEQIYLALVEKMQEARIAEQSELGYIEIIDEAVLPEEPVRPRIPLNLALGAVLGLMLGVGLAFVRNAMDNKIHTPEDLRKHGLNVIGTLPDLKAAIKKDFGGSETVVVEGHRYSTALVTLLNPLSSMSEAYRHVRTGIEFSLPDKPVKVIVVTSAESSEGKSVTAMNLAVAMAQSGRRTVLIDADLRRSTAHRLVGVSREIGLVDQLFEPSPYGMMQFATNIDNLYVIPAGKKVPNPSEILGSRRMHDLLASLRDEFDTIILDTPPVLPVTDALLLATQSDATVLVVGASSTNYHALERATEALQSVNARIIGAVLNRFDPHAAYGGYSYGYSYGYGYGTYYTDEQGLKTKKRKKRLVG